MSKAAGVAIMIAVFFIALGFGYGVSTAVNKVRVHYQVTPVSTVRKCNLPCICRRYINLGTDEWIECMGVGRKPNGNNN